jgi:hypothetical protein
MIDDFYWPEKVFFGGYAWIFIVYERIFFAMKSFLNQERRFFRLRLSLRIDKSPLRLSPFNLGQIRSFKWAGRLKIFRTQGKSLFLGREKLDLAKKAPSLAFWPEKPLIGA